MNSTLLKYDVIIIGGGLAGLCSAIHLSKNKISVLVIEKNSFPQNKVCGEYISNEVLPYLKSLGVDVFKLGATKINSLELSTRTNKLLKAKLPLGGFGISRFCLDNTLAKIATENKATILQDSVEDINFENELFSIHTKKNNIIQATIVIGAYGKRANLDVKLKRNFIKKKSPYLAVKTYIESEFPENTVALHNFKGGYCGVSKVESNRVNVCYITDFNTFKKYKNLEDFHEKIVLKNEYLKTLFNNSKLLLEKPLTISQISFETKKPVENHVIMCGDTAGMIHPLCGNGMSMAIRSAQMASDLIIEYFNDTTFCRNDLEKKYTRLWNIEFKTRLSAGHVVANLFRKDKLATLLISILKKFPSLLSPIIKKTHGKTMIIK